MNATKQPATTKQSAQAKSATVVADTLSNIQEHEARPAPTPVEAPKAYMPVSTKAMIEALEESEGLGRQSFLIELGTGLTLFVESGGVTLESKRMLQTVYVNAGYDADTIQGTEYKSVRRHIEAASSLYDFIGHEEIVDWIGKAKDRRAIHNVIKALDQFSLKGINSVLALVGKPVVAKRKTTLAAPSAHPAGTPSGAATEAQKAAAEAIGAKVVQGRAERATAAVTAPSVILSTEHMTLAIPLSVQKAELIEMSMKILEYAGKLQEIKEPEVALQ